MDKPIFKSVPTQEAIAAIKANGDIKNGKAIVGHVRIAPAGGEAVDIFKLEDGSEVMEKGGKSVQTWPDIEYPRMEEEEALA